MLERAAIAEPLFAEEERAQVTLDSIGDAVLSTDVDGRVTYPNTVVESLDITIDDRPAVDERPQCAPRATR